MNIILDMLRARPEVALFLALGAGYLAGKLQLGSFRLGPVTGCLLAGVAIGQFGITVSPHLQQAFFMFFLFSIGYRVGPQFFNSFNRDAVPQLVVTLVLVATGLGTSLLLARLLGFDTGMAAALLAGGLTESSALGTARDTLGKLGLPAATLAQLEASLASAFAVTYLVGTVGVILLHGNLLPRLLRRPLEDSCREMERKLGVGSADEGASGRREIELRAFRLADRWVGLRIADVEAGAPPDARIRIERIRRGNRLIDPGPDDRLEAGDTAAISGRRSQMVRIGQLAGAEVDDVELLDVPVGRADVVVTRKSVIGRSLGDLRQQAELRPVYLVSLTRAGTAIPLYPGLVVERGDLLKIAGLRRNLAAAIDRFGRSDSLGNQTDMAFVGLFIVVGALLGIPALQMGSVSVGLGLSVGVLFGGLIAGRVRAYHRGVGYVPQAALWLFDSVGLCAFIACVGMAAGPSFAAAIVDSGLLLAGAAIAVLLGAHLVAFLVGSRILDMNEGVLMGTLCGAGTSAAALGAVQAVAKSEVPLLGYGIGYALGAVLLATSGTLLVLLHAPV